MLVVNAGENATGRTVRNDRETSTHATKHNYKNGKVNMLASDKSKASPTATEQAWIDERDVLVLDAMSQFSDSPVKMRMFFDNLQAVSDSHAQKHGVMLLTALKTLLIDPSAKKQAWVAIIEAEL